MTQFNDKLRAALNEAGNEENSLAEVRSLVAQTFTGRAKWITIGAWVKTIIFLVIAIAAVVQFFKTGNIRAMIAWASLFVVSTSSMGMMFTLYWMQLNRNAVTREIKRLELAIAHLRTQGRDA